MKPSGFLLFLLAIMLSCADPQQRSTLEHILLQGDEDFQAVLDDKDAYEVQILFSPITRRDDSVYVVDHYYNFRPDEYFYPASTVKLPVAILALQKLNQIRKAGITIDRDTPMSIDSIRPGQRPVTYQSAKDSPYPSIGNSIDQIFAVSDNDAYNRLYEFVTPEYINRELRADGVFTNSRVIHRVGIENFSHEDNKYTPPIHFHDEGGDIYHTRLPAYAHGDWILPISRTSKGVAHIDENGDLVDKPFDFSKKNYLNIRDMQESLKRLVLPQLYPEQIRYDLSDEDRVFLLRSMARLPREYDYLRDDSTYYDSYVKFFIYGDQKRPIPDHMIIRNKVGSAYGYLTDCAYIQDTKEGIEYFLTATIHVNQNRIYNDGIYEYDDVGIPFLAQLGRLVHAHMIEHKYSHPDRSR